MEVWRGITEGLNAVIVNPSVILGPGNWKSGSGAFFSIVSGGLKYYAHGTNGYVDVRDVSKAMITLMESKISGERFLISAENMSYLDFFTTIALALHMKPPSVLAGPFLSSVAWRVEAIKAKIFFSQPRMTKNIVLSSQKKLCFCNSKIKKEIGMVFRSIESSISEIAVLFKEDNNLS